MWLKNITQIGNSSKKLWRNFAGLSNSMYNKLTNSQVLNIAVHKSALVIGIIKVQVKYCYI